MVMLSCLRSIRQRHRCVGTVSIIFRSGPNIEFSARPESEPKATVQTVVDHSERQILGGALQRFVRRTRVPTAPTVCYFNSTNSFGVSMQSG